MFLLNFITLLELFQVWR